LIENVVLNFPNSFYTHTHNTQSFYCSSGICLGLPGWAGTRKVKPGRVKPIWSGFTGARDSEWQWHLLGYMQVCISSQTTTPASHHSVFYRPGALPDAQPTASKHWSTFNSRMVKLPIENLVTCCEAVPALC